MKHCSRWDDTNTEMFLKICVEEVQIGNRPHSHFTKEGWKNILSKFATRTGLSYNHKQLKNRWNSLKKEFGIWAKLVEHQTGLGWDPIKKTVLASDDWWERKGQENPEYLKWRNEGPKFLDMMEICFKDIVATGYMALVPYAEPSSENEVSNEQGSARMNDVDVEVNNFDDNGDIGDSPQQDNDTPRGETSASQARKRQKTSQRQKKKRANEKLQESFDRLLSGMDNMSRSSNARVENDDHCSITKCVDLLDIVLGIERGSSQYFLM
ncbi:Myb/SANT-like domain-containing protein, partial [Dioscorea alata]